MQFKWQTRLLFQRLRGMYGGKSGIKNAEGKPSELIMHTSRDAYVHVQCKLSRSSSDGRNEGLCVVAAGTGHQSHWSNLPLAFTEALIYTPALAPTPLRSSVRALPQSIAAHKTALRSFLSSSSSYLPCLFVSLFTSWLVRGNIARKKNEMTDKRA